MNLREERMSHAMVKYHVDGLSIPAVFHVFTDIDRGDPHDHPWSFRSIILSGGYTEQVFDLRTGIYANIKRKPGDSFVIPAGHIHRIVDLPSGQCETLILPGQPERVPGFYQFREDGAYHRFWNGDWTKI